MKIPKFIAQLFIPKGPYCYRVIKYMRPDKNQNEDNNGYCKYLGIHDWDDNKWGYLWDSIK